MPLNWQTLTSLNNLLELNEASKTDDSLGFVIFKHSTRCSISSMAKSRLERAWDDSIELPMYYLDLIAHRDISNQIANLFQVEHQSPQILVIKKGVCVYNSSHSNITVEDLKTQSLKVKRNSLFNIRM